MNITFTKPLVSKNESDYIKRSLTSGATGGAGYFSDKCSNLLRHITGAEKVLITTSCTAALEMAAVLLDLKQGDEVIVPSYTFVSTANAFVLRGAVPVFVDVDRNTLNCTAELIEEAITPRTRAIVVVHYAGQVANMGPIVELAKRHDIPLIEDAAQAIGSSINGQHAGTFGDLGCISFHGTKNIVSGEGGALLVNNPRFLERAEIIYEKGTNRSKFLQGAIDKYTWVDIGSSYLASDVTCAYLLGQLEELDRISQTRREYVNQYSHSLHSSVNEIPGATDFSNPETIDSSFNGHMYFLIFPSTDLRFQFLSEMKQQGITAAFHYVPLHSSPGGLKFGRTSGAMTSTLFAGSGLVRLPVWSSSDLPIERVIDCATDALKRIAK